MGSLLIVLLVMPKLQELHRQLEVSFSKSGLALLKEGAQWALAILLALLLVASFVFVFYLYCLPWLGLH